MKLTKSVFVSQLNHRAAAVMNTSQIARSSCTVLSYTATTALIAAELASSRQHCAELHGYYCSNCCRVGELLRALC